MSLSNSLERDLILTGDDAAYFMEACFKRFHVDVGDSISLDTSWKKVRRDLFFF
ncbi:DUF1493 family protein [Caballeronia sp. RCC_10]